MARGDRPLLRTDDARERRFDLRHRPDCLACCDFGAHARHVRGRHHAGVVAEAAANVRRDPRDPLVCAPHWHHDVAVCLAVERASQPAEQHLDHVVAMALHAGGPRERRRHHRSGWRPVHGLPRPVRTVTREADGAEHVTPRLQTLLFVRRERPAAAADGRCHRCEQTLGHERYSLRFVRRLRRLDDVGRVRQLEQVRRQHRLDDDVLIRVLRHRAVVIRERLVARLEERLARADRLHAHPRLLVLHDLAHERRVERAQPFERPERVEARQQVLRRAHHLL